MTLVKHNFRALYLWTLQIDVSVPEEINVNPIEKMDVDEAPIDKNDEMNHMDVDNFVMFIYCYLIKIRMINKIHISLFLLLFLIK